MESLPDDAGEALSDVPGRTSTTHDLLDVQRHYVETFDMRRKCSPYLTYWTHGDTRNRGMALLHFKEAYHEAGLTIDETELPDHLAVVLEFAATVTPSWATRFSPSTEASSLCCTTPSSRSTRPTPTWSAPVLATTSALTPEDELLMQRLALDRPTDGEVGMAGPVDLTLAPFGVQSSDAAMEARR